MKTRKQLPNFGKVPGLHIDIDRLMAELASSNMLDFDIYNDINVQKSNSGDHIDFTTVNSFSKRSFFSEDGSLNGERYRQLYLTQYQGPEVTPQLGDGTTVRDRLRRLDPSRGEYDPIADERNYGKIKDDCPQYLREIIQMFDDTVTRVRLACLTPGFKIKEHVDYDPSYIVRYHIPILTNPLCVLGIIANGEVDCRSLPADGSVYFFNSGHKHWAENKSDGHRLHLIIDVHGQKMLDRVEEFHENSHNV
jgi:hypothetical protein